MGACPAGLATVGLGAGAVDAGWFAGRGCVKKIMGVKSSNIQFQICIEITYFTSFGRMWRESIVDNSKRAPLQKSLQSDPTFWLNVCDWGDRWNPNSTSRHTWP